MQQEAWGSPPVLHPHTSFSLVGSPAARSEDPPMLHPAPAGHVFVTRMERREAVSRQLAPDKGPRDVSPPITHLASPLDHGTARLSPNIAHKATPPASGSRLAASGSPASGFHQCGFRLPAPSCHTTGSQSTTVSSHVHGLSLPTAHDVAATGAP
jgi:hypothetical protein